jgi:hypothetical protein
VVRKAVRKSSKKRRTPRARRRRAPNRAALKHRILSTIRGTGDKPWTVDDLMQAVPCSDGELLLQCCTELVEDGSIDWGHDRPAAEHLPEHLPEHMAFDLPKDWRPPESIGLSLAARQVIDRAVMGMVTVAKPAAAVPSEPVPALAAQIDHELAALITPAVAETLAGLSEDDLRLLMGKNEHRPTAREIKRFAFRTFGDWRHVATKNVMAAAKKDKQFRQAFPILPSYSTFLRALDRKP